VLPLEEMAREVEFLSQFKNDCRLVIRGGAYKGQLYPNKKLVDGVWTATPEEYVGLGDEGADILGYLGLDYHLESCTEVMCDAHVKAAKRHSITWAQVGTRHMGNLPLLRRLRDWSGPVLLKRGMGNSIAEWIGAAAHIEHGGKNEVVLCERGIVTHEHTDPRIRWRPDILAIPQVQGDYGYKVILDCSHSVGRRDLVQPIAKAAMAAGADGVMIEVMEDPTKSMTDAAQGVDHDEFKRIMEAIL
jgi:3-deoxy-7-phosphoheptulonate synthase/chorismate mutase